MVSKVVGIVELHALKHAVVIEHDLGPNVSAQVHGLGCTVRRSDIDVTPHSFILNFKAAVSQPLEVVIIG